MTRNEGRNYVIYFSFPEISYLLFSSSFHPRPSVFPLFLLTECYQFLLDSHVPCKVLTLNEEDCCRSCPWMQLLVIFSFSHYFLKFFSVHRL